MAAYFTVEKFDFPGNLRGRSIHINVMCGLVV